MRVQQRLYTWGPFLEGPEKFSHPESHSKFSNLVILMILYCCCIHVFLIHIWVPITQEVSGAYTSPFLDTDELKMALQAREVSGAFGKRAPGVVHAIWKFAQIWPSLKVSAPNLHEIIFKYHKWYKKSFHRITHLLRDCENYEHTHIHLHCKKKIVRLQPITTKKFSRSCNKVEYW